MWGLCCIAAVIARLQLVGFLCAALGVPDSYPFSRPQLAEFYVHYNFLHLTQYYHRLPTTPSTAAANCCKSHMQVS